MKTALLAAALAFGGTALAQTDGQETTDPATPQTQPPAPPETMSEEPAQPLAASGAGAGTVAPSNENPERDARGIPVISDPAQVPAGANRFDPIPPGATFTPNPEQAQVFAPQPATGEYPACSRTVTDNCLQAYERGRSPEG